MNLDMTISGGGIGGSSGLLDWGSDIARMWGLGIQNGMNFANMYRDMQYRSAIEPSQIEAAYMQNQLAKQQLQNQYTGAYDQGRLDNALHSTFGGTFNAAPTAYQGYVNTNPQEYQRAVSVAPRSSMNTVISNGVSGVGHTNSIPQPISVHSGSTNSALNSGLSSTYGKGG